MRDAQATKDFRALLIAFLREDAEAMSVFADLRTPEVDAALVVSAGLARALGRAWGEDPVDILARVALERAGE